MEHEGARAIVRDDAMIDKENEKNLGDHGIKVDAIWASRTRGIFYMKYVYEPKAKEATPVFFEVKVGKKDEKDRENWRAAWSKRVMEGPHTVSQTLGDLMDAIGVTVTFFAEQTYFPNQGIISPGRSIAEFPIELQAVPQGESDKEQGVQGLTKQTECEPVTKQMENIREEPCMRSVCEDGFESKLNDVLVRQVSIEDRLQSPAKSYEGLIVRYGEFEADLRKNLTVAQKAAEQFQIGKEVLKRLVVAEEERIYQLGPYDSTELDKTYSRLDSLREVAAPDLFPQDQEDLKGFFKEELDKLRDGLNRMKTWRQNPDRSESIVRRIDLAADLDHEEITDKIVRNTLEALTVNHDKLPNLYKMLTEEVHKEVCKVWESVREDLRDLEEARNEAGRKLEESMKEFITKTVFDITKKTRDFIEAHKHLPPGKGKSGEEIKQVMRKIREIAGIEEIEISIGSSLFDPEIHDEVKPQHSDASLPHNVIVDVVRPGYRIRWAKEEILLQKPMVYRNWRS